MLAFGDRDFSLLPDVVEMFVELPPDAQLAVLPGTTHVGGHGGPAKCFAPITPPSTCAKQRIPAHTARTRVDHAAVIQPKAGEPTDRLIHG